MDWCSGSWSNDNILQLLELYKQEPTLWDPRTRNYKNRSSHAFAWNRILSKLPFRTTLDEVKKKKNSLMGYYRIHLNKYNKSLSTAGGGVYQTTWFAFEMMHSFLGPIYGAKKKNITMSPASTTADSEGFAEVKPEPRSSSEDSDQDEMYIVDYDEELPLDTHEQLPLNAEHDSEANVNNNEPITKLISVCSSRVKISDKGDPLSRLASSENEAVINMNSIDTPKSLPDQTPKKRPHPEGDNTRREVKINKQYELDEYDHFGFILASKIRKINSSPEREILMNSIQNLVFETYMKCHKNSSQEK